MWILVVIISSLLGYLMTDPKKPPIVMNGYIALFLAFISIFTIYCWQFILAIIISGYIIPFVLWGLKYHSTEKKQQRERLEWMESNGIKVKTYKDYMPQKTHELSYFDKEYTEKYKEFEALPKSYKEFLIGIEESIFVYFGKFISEEARVLNALDRFRKSHRPVVERMVKDEKSLKKYCDNIKRNEKELLPLKKQAVSGIVGFKIL